MGRGHWIWRDKTIPIILSGGGKYVVSTPFGESFKTNRVGMIVSIDPDTKLLNVFVCGKIFSNLYLDEVLRFKVPGINVPNILKRLLV